MSTGTNDEYIAELADVLETRDVPAEAVAQIVREVESHLAESGEDPREAFGQPDRYADEFAARSRGRDLLVFAVLAFLLGAGGGFMLINAVFGFLDPAVRLWGFGPGMLLAAGVLLLLAFVAAVVALGVRSRRRAASWRM